jgi:hypothetical protein
MNRCSYGGCDLPIDEGAGVTFVSVDTHERVLRDQREQLIGARATGGLCVSHAAALRAALEPYGLALQASGAAADAARGADE